MNDLVGMKTRSYPLAVVFDESKVTTDLIKEYEEPGFFPVGDARPPLVNMSLLLKPMKSLFSWIFYLWTQIPL
jgi:hypothetical protein